MAGRRRLELPQRPESDPLRKVDGRRRERRGVAGLQRRAERAAAEIAERRQPDVAAPVVPVSLDMIEEGVADRVAEGVEADARRAVGKSESDRQRLQQKTAGNEKRCGETGFPVADARHQSLSMGIR